MRANRGAGLVIDHSKHLNRVVAFDAAAQTVTVEPGIVLDELNGWLRKHGLWFPVDVSTSAQATLGGMAGNNSCGSRSLYYGNMVHNVAALDVRLADGTEARFGPERDMKDAPPRVRELVAALRSIGEREHDEIARVVPRVMRRVGGYNADVFNPQSERPVHGGRQRQPRALARRQRRHARMDADAYIVARAAAPSPRARRRQLRLAACGDGRDERARRHWGHPRSSSSIGR